MIEEKELEIALITLGFANTSKEDIKRLVAEFDTSGRLTINFSNFVRVIEALLLTRDAKSELEDAFKLFDIDGTGLITLQNLKDVVTSMGEQLTEQEIIEILAAADKNGTRARSMRLLT